MGSFSFSGQVKVLKEWMNLTRAAFFVKPQRWRSVHAAFVTRPEKDKNQRRERTRKKEFFFASFSLCLALFCSPLRSYISSMRCMKFTLSQKPNTTPPPSVAVCLQANYGIHNIAQVWGKPVITPMPKIAHDPFDSLFYTYLFPLVFSSALFERAYMHVICVDRKLRRDLHARPDQELPVPGFAHS